MKQIFVDPTSKNCMFSSLEPQGSFLFHRFGKREIPQEHLDISKLKNFLKSHKPQQIILESVFGDPLEYKHIVELADYCKDKSIQIICITNGFSDNFLKLKEYNFYFIFKIYAFTETHKYFYPEENFNKLIDNLVYCNKIQYNIYRENLKDLENVNNFSKKLEVEFVRGPLVHLNINHIISSKGKWICDVYGLHDFDVNDYNYESLLELPNNFTPQQTMEGYHLLKNYVKPPFGTSIENAVIYKANVENNLAKQKSISYKGHIFDSVEERNIITNTYIPDWDITLLNTDDNYQKSIVGMLSKFSNGKKESI